MARLPRHCIFTPIAAATQLLPLQCHCSAASARLAHARASRCNRRTHVWTAALRACMWLVTVLLGAGGTQLHTAQLLLVCVPTCGLSLRARAAAAAAGWRCCGASARGCGGLRRTCAPRPVCGCCRRVFAARVCCCACARRKRSGDATRTVEAVVRACRWSHGCVPWVVRASMWRCPDVVCVSLS
jgi:hypothetical protein